MFSSESELISLKSIDLFFGSSITLSKLFATNSNALSKFKDVFAEISIKNILLYCYHQNFYEYAETITKNERDVMLV